MYNFKKGVELMVFIFAILFMPVMVVLMAGDLNEMVKGMVDIIINGI